VRVGSVFANAASLESVMKTRLKHLVGFGIDAVRVRGLWAGIDLSSEVGTGRAMAEDLVARGVLSKDTHGQTLRLSPPLNISREDLMWGLDRVEESLAASRQ
jgi:ornithine--oxo-acid transaminase